VFTSPGGAAQATGFAVEGVTVLDDCQDMIDWIQKLRCDETNLDEAAKERNKLFPGVCESPRHGVMSYASEQAAPREVEMQREIQKIGGNTEKYIRYLELTAKQANSITFTIPRGRRWWRSRPY